MTVGEQQGALCGIAGFTNLDGAPPDPAVLAAMAATLRHRGPDDRGTHYPALRHSTPDTALAFERLSILDLSPCGHQPMLSDDGAIAVLLNGEIYNAFDFRSELAGEHRFHSRTDTEIVLALYQRHGIDGLLDRLNGMFALVIADARRGELHLARDQFGIKPLYWTQCGAAILFASETKAFLAHPAFRAEIDPAHLDEVLAFRYVAGGGSLLKGVQQVQPAHRLTIAANGTAESRYWSLPESAGTWTGSRADAVDRLDELLTRSVRSQLRSDVKVGAQLSGGLDSSLVALRAAPIDAFAVAITDRVFSETKWIDQAAAVTGAECHRIDFSADDFVDALDAASWHMDQPISQPNSLALWRLAQQARDRVTVLLSGEGADEVFAGYRRFLIADESPGAFVRATQFHAAGRLSRVRPGADIAPAIERRLAIFNTQGGDHLSKCVAYEMQTHLQDLLIRQDKMMMAHGIENRVPFLDRDLVSFARSLPKEFLIRGESTKVIIKDLARRAFDDVFVDRRKSGFNLPLAQYFRNARFVALMEDRLLPGMASRGLVDVTVVRRWWRRALSGPATTEAFWPIVALELWAQQFIERRSAAVK